MPHQQFACTRLFHLHLMRSCRTFSVTFTTSSLSTPAAYGGLKSAPTSRFRRISLHLRYSIVPKHVLDTTPHRTVRALLCMRLPPWMSSDGERGVLESSVERSASTNPTCDHSQSDL